MLYSFAGSPHTHLLTFIDLLVWEISRLSICVRTSPVWEKITPYNTLQDRNIQYTVKLKRIPNEPNARFNTFLWQMSPCGEYSNQMIAVINVINIPC